LLFGTETAAEVGDEPLQFKLKFPQAQVAVDENRRRGIEKLREQKKPPEIILLDDAFQHRSVKAGLNILLTTFNAPFYKDLMLPSGNLREPKRGAKRADIIVVTKCPENLPGEKMDEIRKKLKLEAHQQAYFSGISYSEEIMGKNTSRKVTGLENFTLVTGIANPKPLVNHLKSKNLDFEHLAFPDHHHFTASELEKIKSKSPILTTEKDYMRLKDQLPEADLFFLPIKTKFLENTEGFERRIMDFVSA
jgi:tetraacyldisaccharide 4'-kinase